MKDISLIRTEAMTLLGQDLILHPFGGMYWKECNLLVVSDTHFGKVSHFRKAGIAVPLKAVQRNWDRMEAMIYHFNPEKIIILGDLFHSSYNVEWELWVSFLEAFPSQDFLLIAGNHDILDRTFYDEAGIAVLDSLEIGPFLFTHEPIMDRTIYNIHGHVHPAAVVQGGGRQRMRLPCFYFGKEYAILPAFGSFTGTATIPISEEDEVYVIVKNKVIHISTS